MANHDSDNEELALSSSALDALKEFYAERDARAEQFAKLQAEAEKKHADADGAASAEAGGEPSWPISMEAFTEDWNESQFWYSNETATLLAKQLLEGATAESTIAVVSAPSVFVALKNLVNSPDAKDKPKPKMVLLEHDNRFGVFPEFVFYDFAQPLKLPGHLKGSVDRIICDPPFLSEDCQTKAALTVRWISKTPVETTKLIVCTGERMETLVNKVYKAFGLKTSSYEPVHARGLSNEFYCYANFTPGDGAWKWRAGKDS